MEGQRLERAEDETRAQQLVISGLVVDIATARLVVAKTREVEERKAHDRSRVERSDDT